MPYNYSLVPIVSPRLLGLQWPDHGLANISNDTRFLFRGLSTKIYLSFLNSGSILHETAKTLLFNVHDRLHLVTFSLSLLTDSKYNRRD